MFLIIEKLKPVKKIPEPVLILLTVLKQVTFSSLKTFSIRNTGEINLVISAGNKTDFTNLTHYSTVTLPPPDSL